jgi:hypothetical protein
MCSVPINNHTVSIRNFTHNKSLIWNFALRGSEGSAVVKVCPGRNEVVCLHHQSYDHALVSLVRLGWTGVARLHGCGLNAHLSNQGWTCVCVCVCNRIFVSTSWTGCIKTIDSTLFAINLISILCTYTNFVIIRDCVISLCTAVRMFLITASS